MKSTTEENFTERFLCLGLREQMSFSTSSLATASSTGTPSADWCSRCSLTQGSPADRTAQAPGREQGARHDADRLHTGAHGT